MQPWENHLVRWESAGVVDPETAGRIRAFEAVEERPSGQRWQVVVALILGGMLLAAGLLLFVAAHWDQVSPMQRLALVVGLLAALHLGGILCAEHFPAMSTALHGVGTVGAGAAIAMVGQIFNMQEHWPAAVLMWALCAAAGWWCLRDQFQQICTLLLFPAWIVCEWSYRADLYRSNEVYLSRMIAVIAAVYLTAFLHSRRKAVWGILFAISSIALIIVTVLLSEGWDRWSSSDSLPLSLKSTAIGFMLLMAVVGFFLDKRSLAPVFAITVMAFALPWLQVAASADGSLRRQPSVPAYALVAGVAAFLAWWGVRRFSRALVNYGVVMFGGVVLWFYSSSLMDKLGRSLGLIGLGLVFLLGGYVLERARRRLITDMRKEVQV